MYLCYNAFWIYLFVGRQVDPQLLERLFKTGNPQQMNLAITEEELFAEVESDPYLNSLYSLVNQVRYQR